MPRHAVISGASIAGPALAQQLNTRGWTTTVLERAPQLRDEGHNVDITGIGCEVADRMKITDEVRAANTGEQGMRLIGEHGDTLASLPADGHDTATAELEILRGELARIFYERTAADTDYRFGTTIRDLDDRGDHVAVTLSDGQHLRADVVVLAEGLRSRTREMVFGATSVQELGLYCAFLTIPRTETDTAWWSWYQALGGRSVHLRPDNLGTTRAMLSFRTDVRGLERLERADQVMILRRTFADAGWETPRVLDALDDAPYYLDGLGQVHLDRWSSGRIAVVGDCAYCASPLSGMSTTLALAGAYVLAEELARTEDPREAMTRYEALMRPLVRDAQKLPPGALRLGNPYTSAERTQFRVAMRFIGHPLLIKVGSAVGGLIGTPPPRLELPTY